MGTLVSRLGSRVSSWELESPEAQEVSQTDIWRNPKYKSPSFGSRERRCVQHVSKLSLRKLLQGQKRRVTITLSDANTNRCCSPTNRVCSFSYYPHTCTVTIRRPSPCPRRQRWVLVLFVLYQGWGSVPLPLSLKFHGFMSWYAKICDDLPRSQSGSLQISLYMEGHSRTWKLQRGQ